VVALHPVTRVPVDGLPDTALTPSVQPVLVPAVRYTSEAFARREEEQVWPRVWQVACTADHVPEPGDFYEYRCGPLAVLIVRGADGQLRAFQNACRHRGNTICQGAGGGLTELRCGFHRWVYDLDGHLREVPSRRGFGPGFRNEDFGLFPVQIDSWGPLVFVNLDVAAPPLADYLEGVPGDSAWAALEEFQCQYALTMPVESNWKVVAEGFSETYHVQGIHPEMVASIDDLHAPQKLWGNCGVSYQAYGVPNPRLGRDVADAVVWESMVLTQGGRFGVDVEPAGPDGGGPVVPPLPRVPEGGTVREVIADRIRALQAARGVELSRYSTDQLLTLSQYNLFPNVTVLVWGDMLNVLVARPGATADSALFVAWTFHRLAPGARRTRIEDIALPPGADMGTVLSEDLALLRTAQRGLHQPGLVHIALSNEECRVINLHRNLERYLGIEPSEMLPI